MTRSGLVQIPDRGLGVRYVRGEVAGRGEIPSGERIGQVGVIAVALMVAAGHPLQSRFLSSPYVLGHPSAPTPLRKGNWNSGYGDSLLHSSSHYDDLSIVYLI